MKLIRSTVRNDDQDKVKEMSLQLEVFERLGTHYHATVDARVVLSHEQRDKGRLKVTSSDGAEVRIFLERGSPLQVGEFLRTRCGKHVLIEGAYENVVTATCKDWFTFSRACYHLGNRHVKVQLGLEPGKGLIEPVRKWLRILPDHVLEEMLELLGLELSHEIDIFNPESGAYSHGHHHH